MFFPQALSWENAVITWSSFYFGGHVAMVAVYILLAYIVPSAKKKQG